MRYPAAALLTAIAIMPLGEAAAARLDKDACEALKSEQARLIEGGTKADMERGPDWAKANLAPDRLKRIERLLEVEEGLAFRCPQPRPAPTEAEAKGEPAAAPARRSANGKTEPGKPAGAETKARANPRRARRRRRATPAARAAAAKGGRCRGGEAGDRNACRTGQVRARTQAQGAEARHERRLLAPVGDGQHAAAGRGRRRAVEEGVSATGHSRSAGLTAAGALASAEPMVYDAAENPTPDSPGYAWPLFFLSSTS